MNLHEDLKAYVDRELPPVRMAEIADAVAADPALAREVQRLTALSQAVRLADEEVPVLGLDQTLRALDRHRPRPVWGRWVPLVALAASVVGLFTIYRGEMSRSVADDSVAMERSTVAKSKMNSQEELSPSRKAGNVEAPALAMPAPIGEAAVASVLEKPRETKVAKGEPGPKFRSMARVRVHPATKRAPTKDAQRTKDVVADASPSVLGASVTNVKASSPKTLPPVALIELEVSDLSDAEAAIRLLAQRTGVEMIPAQTPTLDSQASPRTVSAPPTSVVLRFEVDETALEAFKKESKEVVTAPQTLNQQYAGRFQGGGAFGGAGGVGGLGGGGGFGGGGGGGLGPPAGGPEPAAPVASGRAKTDPPSVDRGVGLKSEQNSARDQSNRVKSESDRKPRRIIVMVKLKKKAPEP